MNQFILLQYVTYNKFLSENISPHFCRNKCFINKKDTVCIHRDFLNRSFCGLIYMIRLDISYELINSSD